MAKQDSKINRQEDQQLQTRESARGSQRGLARRGGYDPFGSSLTPNELFRMNPFSLMRRMTEEVDRALGELGRGNGGDAVWLPTIEVSERDGNYIVHAELPGLKPDEVKVEVTDGALVIEGERKFEHEESNGGVQRTERRYGRFYRSIPLPEGANVEQARARFENGVLEVTVPVPEQQSNRREIPIEASSTGSAAGSGKAA